MVDNDLYNLFTEYGIALSNIQHELNILATTYSKLEEDNPIEYINSRIKSASSIEGKLNKLKEQTQRQNEVANPLDYEFTAQNIENHLHDVVGIRIVCPFLSDAYQVIEKVKKINSIEIVDKKDYIETPKTNGYASYHLKVLVPITIPNTKKIKKVKAEIQIRTITMDMIASLEHEIYYKKDITLSPITQKQLNRMIQFCYLMEKDLNKILIQKRTQKIESKIYKPLPKFMKTEKFDNYMTNHQKALEIIEEKLTKFREQYITSMNRKPYEHTKSRIKSKHHIIEKLERKKIAVNFQNIDYFVNDIAGFRIVCPFLDDVKNIIEAFHEDKTMTIIEEQDYMDTPKDNGYTSYHLLVLVPVITENGSTNIKVEIQIRTLCQEMWAIFQERLCYKKEPDKSLESEFKRLAPILSVMDYNMNEMIQYYSKQQKDNKRKVLNK